MNMTNYFSMDNLKEVYYTYIQDKCSTGLDGINKETFERSINDFLADINRKVLNNTYSFTPYKQKLIIKGKNKYPRLISIPTIRDKITLKVLHGVLSENIKVETEQSQMIIGKLKSYIETNKFDTFIKLDIKDFYPSINHKILRKEIKKDIKSRKFLRLLFNSITTATGEKGVKNTKGVPQGLSISNILANIYLKELDDVYKNTANIVYFRYVDDILILCSSTDCLNIKEEIFSHFKKLKLKINKEKTYSDSLDNGFSFLGYEFSNHKFTVRTSSKKKLEDSLIKIFSEYKYSDFKKRELFLWQLNLRITGCVYHNHGYGWLFYFSKIDDIKLLFKFDSLVSSFIKKFKIDNISRLELKKFIRAYHEINKNKIKTTYIPNFDLEVSLEDKKVFLRDIMNVPSVNLLSDKQIVDIYRSFINRTINDLERDVQEIY